MLKRVRIEVEADSPDEALEELDKYEHALQSAEAERFGLGYEQDDYVIRQPIWGDTVDERTWYDERLGRDVREEVIEFVKGVGYLGRRVVAYVGATHRNLDADPEAQLGRARRGRPLQAPVEVDSVNAGRKAAEAFGETIAEQVRPT